MNTTDVDTSLGTITKPAVDVLDRAVTRLTHGLCTSIYQYIRQKASVVQKNINTHEQYCSMCDRYHLLARVYVNIKLSTSEERNAHLEARAALVRLMLEGSEAVPMCNDFKKWTPIHPFLAPKFLVAKSTGV